MLISRPTFHSQTVTQHFEKTEMKEEILNQKIKQLYFSESYSSSIYSLFVDLENGDRFRLINRGVSYSDCSNRMEDLLPIYVDSQIMPRSFYTGQRIIEIRKPENDWASIILENGVEIGIRNNSCLLYTSPSPRDRQKSRMPSSA